MLRYVIAVSAVLLCDLQVNAQEVRLTEDKASSSFAINGQSFTIARNPDPTSRIPEAFTLTSRACPPFCIHPMSVADDVETLGELEVITFLETQVSAGTGVLMDSRLPDFYLAGTIPGAVNVPFSILDPSNPFLPEILRVLGAVETAGGRDFSNALDLVLFCNGPWCDQSPRAIRGLLAAGYPPDKIGYYRGGMQDWVSLGLTTLVPQAGG